MEAFIVVSLFISAVVGRLYLSMRSAEWLDQLTPAQRDRLLRHAGLQ